MKQIGWLHEHKVFCIDCGSNDQVEIYFDNIYPYSQKCFDCKKTLVEGKENWPELFEG